MSELASFPGLPILISHLKHAGLPLLCTIVNANKGKERGRPGNEAMMEQSRELYPEQLQMSHIDQNAAYYKFCMWQLRLQLLSTK